MLPKRLLFVRRKRNKVNKWILLKFENWKDEKERKATQKNPIDYV